jgi:hypothetical protein
MIPNLCLLFSSSVILDFQHFGKKQISDIGLLWLMVFKAIFNNISVISWRSVLFVEETGVPGENHRPVASR